MARRKHKESEPVLEFMVKIMFFPVVLLVALFMWLEKK